MERRVLNVVMFVLMIGLTMGTTAMGTIYNFDFNSAASYADWRSYVVETESLTSNIDGGGLILYDSWWVDRSNPAPANLHPDIDMLVRRSDNMLQLDQGNNEYRYNILMRFPLAVSAGAGSQFRVTYKNRADVAATTFSVYGPTPHTTLDTTAVHLSTASATLTAQDTGWVTIPAGLTEVKVAMIMKAGTTSVSYIDDMVVEIVPEPITLGLLLSGFAGLLLRRRMA